MFLVVLYVITGVVVGAIVAFALSRILVRGNEGADSVGLTKQLVAAEADLRVANDRLMRSEENLIRLQAELTEVAKQRDDLNAKHASTITLLEQTSKQFEALKFEQTAQKEEHKQKTDAINELNKKLSSYEAQIESLNGRLKSYVDEVENLKVERGQLQGSLSESRERSVDLDKENKYLKEMLDKQKKEVDDIGSKFSNEFKLLADKILEDKSKRFTELNSNNIQQLLKPLGENIQMFQKKVEEVYDRESKERFSLGKEVEKLVLINQKISEEANNLTNALKGQVKQQGNWGEMILESILDRSGLTKGREYFVQETIKDEDGRRFQPDVIINYPDNRKLVIDSKVSLVAYERYCSSENKEEQDKEMASHVRSIRSHIDILSSKGYQDLVGGVDFVTMFLPVEPAFILAMQADPEIWNYAYSKGVLMLSPTNLIAALRLIHNLWQREYQTKNAMDIAERGGRLYDKFVSFVESLTSIGQNLTRSQESYDQAMKQLTTGSGNLVNQAEKLKGLGVKAKKSMPANLLDNHNNESEQLSEPEEL